LTAAGSARSAAVVGSRPTRGRGSGRRGRSCRWRRVARRAAGPSPRSTDRQCGPLCQRMAPRFAVGAESGIDDDELGSGVHDRRALNLGFEPEHASVAPSSTKRAVAQFRDGLERDQCRAAGDDRRVALREVCARDEIGAEDVRVDDDRPAWPTLAHDSTAARKAAPSSSSMSSMTISLCGGKGRARRRSSSTGSSRCCSSALSARCVATVV
jgi:hypothetical protein